ncbi:MULTISPECIES: helix-turn-helix domain-containing protein [Haloarcula]|uniref:helix-turn-helix domain-containing protein n=1 Tax=Haloarcula TaxID=2237 RepID=UPI0023EA8066|nr:helix-turn-helix domain-containing protein [Halomicroarcula sp. XH51]
MTDRLLTEVEVFRPQSCMVYPHASEEWVVDSVTRRRFGTDHDRVVEEFTLKGEGDEPPIESEAATGLEEVFAHESGHIYRFEREPDRGCICERIERRGSLVHEFRAGEDTTVVTFLSPDAETLRAVIEDLRSEAECVQLRRLIESADGVGDNHPVVLDREMLTDRQREVLERAFELGYFDHPRNANAGEVAADLSITTSTFTEHLAASQRKLLEALFSG